MYKLNFSNSNGLQILAKGKGWTIQIDMDTRIFQFYTIHEYEKSKWRECLSNSLHYCRDIKNSITKNPRLINKLVNILNSEGVGSLKLKIEEELDTIIKANEM